MTSNAQTAVSVPEFPWWIVLIEGIFALLFGIFLIAEPVITSVFLVTVLGFYWLIRGIFSLIQIFIGNTGIHWGWLLFGGILGILAGLVVLRHPLYATILVGSVLVIIVAIDGIIMGIVGLVQAFSGAGWGAGILGVLSIIIGAILLANVWAATAVLPYVLAAFMIVGGIAAIVFSFRLRNV
jgi:uncharacterized membrane protein HdeD (DUF308 family)